MNIGIAEKDCKDIAKSLSKLLSDTYILYLKTHNFHWNVKGPMFQTLHLMFETQYNELALAVDLIAERIRALNEPAPGTYAEYLHLGTLKETIGVPHAKEMIKILMKDQEAVIHTAKEAFIVADKASDEATLDILTQRIQTHEKIAWMLRSMLEE